MKNITLYDSVYGTKERSIISNTELIQLCENRKNLKLEDGSNLKESLKNVKNLQNCIGRIYEDGKFRGDGDLYIKDIGFIALDIDSIEVTHPLVVDTTDTMTRVDYSCVVYHSISSTKEKPRIRVLVPVESIDSGVIGTDRTQKLKLLLRLMVDKVATDFDVKHCLDSSSYRLSGLFFLPCDVNGFSPGVYVKHGKMLQCYGWDTLVVEEAVKEESLNDVTVTDAAEMLSFINPRINYHDWIRVGMAIKHQFRDDGKELFIDWSTDFTNNSETLLDLSDAGMCSRQDAESKWYQLGSESKTGESVTFGTVFKMAYDAGYRGRITATDFEDPYETTDNDVADPGPYSSYDYSGIKLHHRLPKKLSAPYNMDYRGGIRVIDPNRPKNKKYIEFSFAFDNDEKWQELRDEIGDTDPKIWKLTHKIEIHGPVCGDGFEIKDEVPEDMIKYVDTDYFIGDPRAMDRDECIDIMVEKLGGKNARFFNINDYLAYWNDYGEIVYLRTAGELYNSIKECNRGLNLPWEDKGEYVTLAEVFNHFLRRLSKYTKTNSNSPWYGSNVLDTVGYSIPKPSEKLDRLDCIIDIFKPSSDVDRVLIKALFESPLTNNGKTPHPLMVVTGSPDEINQTNTGKTTLCQILRKLWGNKDSAFNAQLRDETRMASEMFKDNPERFIYCDDTNGHIQSTLLNTIITDEKIVVNGYYNTSVRRDNDLTITIAGNNLTFSPDLLRRILPIQLLRINEPLVSNIDRLNDDLDRREFRYGIFADMIARQKKLEITPFPKLLIPSDGFGRFWRTVMWKACDFNEELFEKCSREIIARKSGNIYKPFNDKELRDEFPRDTEKMMENVMKLRNQFGDEIFSTPQAAKVLGMRIDNTARWFRNHPKVATIIDNPFGRAKTYKLNPRIL